MSKLMPPANAKYALTYAKYANTYNYDIMISVVEPSSGKHFAVCCMRNKKPDCAWRKHTDNRWSQELRIREVAIQQSLQCCITNAKFFGSPAP